MRGVQRWFTDSVPVQVLVSFAAVCALTKLLKPDLSTPVWLAQSLLCTAFAAAWLAHRRIRDARALGEEPHHVLRAERLIRHREVPGDPRLRASVRRVVSRRRSLLHRTRWIPPMFLGMAVLALCCAATAGPWHLFLLTAGVWAGACALLVWSRRRSARLLRFMALALGADPALA